MEVGQLENWLNCLIGKTKERRMVEFFLKVTLTLIDIWKLLKTLKK